MVTMRAPLQKEDLRSETIHGEPSVSAFLSVSISFTMIITLTNHHFSTAMERKLAADV